MVLKIALWPKAVALLRRHVWLLDGTDVPQIAPCWNAILVHCSAPHRGTGDTKVVSEGVSPVLTFSWGDGARRYTGEEETPQGNYPMPFPAFPHGGKPSPSVVLVAVKDHTPFAALFLRLRELKQWHYKVPATNILLIHGANDLPSLFCSKEMFYLGSC